MHNVSNELVSAVVEATTRAARVNTVSRELALLRGRNGMLVAASALLAFGAIFTVVKARRSDAVDVAITLRLQARQHQSLATLMEVVSWPGFPPQSRLIPPMAIATLFVMRMRTEALFQLIAWSGVAGASTIVKGFARRPRPLPEQVRVVIAPLGGSSFPSGHVLTYVGTYGFLAYLVYTVVRPPQVRWPMTIGLVGLVGLVGPSRIYQGHHWPTDVVASYLLGLSYLIGLMALYRRVKGRSSIPIDGPVVE